MQSRLPKVLAAAALLSCTAAVLAQPVARNSQWVVQAPAAVAPAATYGRDHDRDDHDRDGHDRDRRDHDGWRHAGQRDERAPMINDLTPRPGERVGERYRMTVSARFEDDASGVDPASVRLHIDGRDVTSASRIEGAEVRFHNNLFPGRHVAEVTVRDRAGNTARRSWEFDVVDRDRDGYRDEDRRGEWGWQR